MVLSDIDIRAEIAARRLVFDPPINPNSDRIDSSTIDLMLHEELLILPQQQVSGLTVEPTDPDFNVMDLLQTHGCTKVLTTSSSYRLDKHHLILGKTLEIITLPSHLAARIEGKSSLARLGLSVHITAPTVVAGFKGRLYLEIHNSGPFRINLSPEMKIAQLILEQVSLPPLKEYRGQFKGQE